MEAKDGNGGPAKRRKGEASASSHHHHIRFSDDAETDAVSRSTAPSSSSAISTASSKQSSKKKRKRKRPATRDDASTCNKVLNGLIVAVSALESKSKESNSGGAGESDDYQNYKFLQQSLASLGATLSPQVHKRVHYLISTDTAVQNLTQRVRQAMKRNVDIVDVAWVKECRDTNTRVDVTGYLQNEVVKCLMADMEREKREKAASGGDGKDDSRQDEADDLDIRGPGWSTPVALDCCCVCHENGDNDCPWCSDCNLTLARKAKKSTDKPEA